MSTLFGKKEVSGAHAVFKHLRDSKLCKRDREVIEELWDCFQPLADSKFMSEFQRDTPSRIWEMRLGCALLGIGFKVSSEDHGPDLRVKAPCLFELEAVAPEEGDDENRVPRLGEGGISSTIGLKLRWRYFRAFEKKADKFRKYRQKRVIEQKVPLVIAISGSKIPEAYWQDTNPIPSLLGLCFGKFASSSHDPALKLYAAHSDDNPDEPLNVFRPGEQNYADISAVLASAIDIKNSWEVHGLGAGRDFMVIHNPNATVPLPQGTIPLGREFWLEGKELREHVWRAPLEE